MNRYCSDFPQESSCPRIAAIPASCSLQVDHIPTTWTLQVMYTDPVGPNFEFSPMLTVLPRFPRIDQTPPMLVVLPRFPRIDSILPNNLILIIWLYVWIRGGGHCSGWTMLVVLPRFPRINPTPPMLVVLPRFPRIDSTPPNNPILIIWLSVWIRGGGVTAPVDLW